MVQGNKCLSVSKYLERTKGGGGALNTRVFWAFFGSFEPHFGQENFTNDLKAHRALSMSILAPKNVDRKMGCLKTPWS